jgi:mannose-6-phosphate isomerase-like protein (cupin superfamily)
VSDSASESPDPLFAVRLAGEVVGTPETSIVIAEWTDPGCGAHPPVYIAPLHVHHDDDEAWYVLDGLLCVRLGDKEFEVPTGGALIARRGTPHTYWNPRPDPARYLLVMTPRIHALIDALHALIEPNERSVAATFADHASEYLGWP